MGDEDETAGTQAPLRALCCPFSPVDREVKHKVGWGHNTHYADMSQEAAIT